jgi:hypothetical protein
LFYKDLTYDYILWQWEEMWQGKCYGIVKALVIGGHSDVIQ